MRVVLQRVAQAKVSVGGEVIAEVGHGLLLLLGIHSRDAAEAIPALAAKIVNLRIFPGSGGRIDRSLLDTNRAILLVSQFTLYGDTRKGRRPSFTEAAQPEIAEPLYRKFADEIRSLGVPVSTGRFGLEMSVVLVNDGPFTLVLDTDCGGFSPTL